MRLLGGRPVRYEFLPLSPDLPRRHRRPTLEEGNWNPHLSRGRESGLDGQRGYHELAHWRSPAKLVFFMGDASLLLALGS
jgi:hypothetical protein